MKSWLKGPPQPDADTDAQSLLASWKEYAGQSDVEAGSISGTIGSAVSSAQARPSLAAAGEFAMAGKAQAQKIGAGIQNAPATVQGVVKDLPSGTQLTYATFLLGSGGVLLLIAIFIALPVIVLSPSKFAMSFTLGCGCLVAGMTVLKGWRTQLTAMTQPDRLPFSAGYVGSALATLWAAASLHSYLLSILFSGVQVAALAYYVASYLPGGVAGLRAVSMIMMQTVTRCFGMVASGR